MTQVSGVIYGPHFINLGDTSHGNDEFTTSSSTEQTTGWWSSFVIYILVVYQIYKYLLLVFNYSSKKISFIFTYLLCFTDSTGSDVEMCPCECEFKEQIEFWENKPPTELDDIIESKINEMKKELQVNLSQLTSTKIKKISAPDSRMSASMTGYVGVVFIVLVLGSIVILDFPTLVLQVQRLFRRLKAKWSSSLLTGCLCHWTLEQFCRYICIHRLKTLRGSDWIIITLLLSYTRIFSVLYSLIHLYSCDTKRLQFSFVIHKILHTVFWR